MMQIRYIPQVNMMRLAQMLLISDDWIKRYAEDVSTSLGMKNDIYFSIRPFVAFFSDLVSRLMAFQKVKIKLFAKDSEDVSISVDMEK